MDEDCGIISVVGQKQDTHTAMGQSFRYHLSGAAGLACGPGQRLRMGTFCFFDLPGSTTRVCQEAPLQSEVKSGSGSRSPTEYSSASRRQSRDRIASEVGEAEAPQ